MVDENVKGNLKKHYLDFNFVQSDPKKKYFMPNDVVLGSLHFTLLLSIKN